MEDAAGIHAVIINYVFLYGPNTAAGQLQRRGTALPRPTPTPRWERPRRSRGGFASLTGPVRGGHRETGQESFHAAAPQRQGRAGGWGGPRPAAGPQFAKHHPELPQQRPCSSRPRLLSPSPRWPQGAPGPALNKDGASARQAPLALTKDGSRPLSSFLPSTKMAASPPPADWPSALTLARPRRTRRGPRARPGVPRAPPAGRKRERGGC